MTANVDAMIRAGVDAYRNGDKTEARALLERAIELDDHNETAWLWLSAVVDTQEEQQTCLENVLVVNPTNERARQGLRSLGIDPDSVAGAEPQASAPAFTDDVWNVPTSSASSEASAPKISSDQYDDWMSNLNIGSDTTETTSSSFDTDTSSASGDSGSAAQQQEDIFGSDDFALESDTFDFGDDLFDDDTFDGGEYSYDEEGNYEETYDETGYDDTAYDDNAYDPQYADDYTDYDDNYATDEGELYSDTDFYSDDASATSFDSAVDDGIYDTYDESEFSGDPYAEAYDDEEEEPTAAELFQQIPIEIKPTRVPGRDEKPTSSAGIITAVLGVANVAAIALVLFRFFV